ncbi:MAG: serine protease [Candidatus Sumerlaeota bacterium]|nr:serine protease [Candidatus Sumerlaeota bacterium]
MLVLSILMLFCFYCSAQEGRKIELNSYLMQSTFRLVGDKSTTETVTGTAFIIGRQSKTIVGQNYFVLITAAHVLENMKGDQATLILRKVNKKDWSYEKVPYQIKIRQNGKPLWTRHDDKDVDVAAMYIIVPSVVEITLLPMDFLADDNDLGIIGIHPGDELMCVGYPSGMSWGSGDLPILRSGKIASHTLLPTKTTKVFLYDFEVSEGNSGSPVYMSDRLHPIPPQETEKISPVVIQVNTIVGMVLGQYFHKGVPLKLALVVHASLIKETIEKLPEQP